MPRPEISTTNRVSSHTGCSGRVVHWCDVLAEPTLVRFLGFWHLILCRYIEVPSIDRFFLYRFYTDLLTCTKYTLAKILSIVHEAWSTVYTISPWICRALLLVEPKIQWPASCCAHSRLGVSLGLVATFVVQG